MDVYQYIICIFKFSTPLSADRGINNVACYVSLLPFKTLEIVSNVGDRSSHLIQI